MQNSSHICLACRIANKAGGTCPSCKGKMEYMGTRFRAPKKREINEWKRLELILTARDSNLNMCTQWCCVNYRTAPKTLGQTKRWLRKRLVHRSGEIPKPRAPRYMV